MTSRRGRFAERTRLAAARLPGLLGMPILLVAFLAATVAIHPTFNSFDAQSLAMAAMPLAFAAAAQALVVISGGIDLSVGSVMAVATSSRPPRWRMLDLGSRLSWPR